MFWAYFFGTLLVLAALIGPFLGVRIVRKHKDLRMLRKGVVLGITWAPLCFVVSVFAGCGIEEIRFNSRWHQVKAGMASDEVTSIMGAPDGILPPGSVSEGSTWANQTPIWVYVPPREDSILQVTNTPPFVRFKHGLDDIFRGSSISSGYFLQMTRSNTVHLKEDWEGYRPRVKKN